MFILDAANSSLNGNETPTPNQFSARKQKYYADIPIPDDAQKNPLLPAPHPIKLKSLFMSLVKQKHWIYFLNQDIQLRAAHLPVLQVKLKEHHIQSECVERIATSGHCSAIVVESNKMDKTQLQRVQALCSAHKVKLIFLENLTDNDNLH